MFFTYHHFKDRFLPHRDFSKTNSGMAVLA